MSFVSQPDEGVVHCTDSHPDAPRWRRNQIRAQTCKGERLTVLSSEGFLAQFTVATEAGELTLPHNSRMIGDKTKRSFY
jgi:hypothetical protein